MLISEGVPPVLRISAALLVRADGKTLLVSKRGTTTFMQPGGKIDPGETAPQALVRELNEELGISVDIDALSPLGQFSAPAANEAGVTVEAALFMVQCDQEVRPAAEIEEAVWIESDTRPDFAIAPLTGDHVLPLHNKLRANLPAVPTNFPG
jgi:8-oxo-dGTP pyrophosphatase MutT (NUDIX family)